MKEFLKSKKVMALITGIVADLLALYVFKDNQEMATQASLTITGLVSTYLLGQGAADAFGTDYHKKPKKK